MESRRFRWRVSWLLGVPLVAAVACGHAGTLESGDHSPPDTTEADRRTTPPARPTVTLSIVGTNDLHGHVDRVPLLVGHVDNLARVRTRGGGGVLLVDGGDMFQGTLASNLTEGASVVRAMNAAGYAVAAVGNHEFDYGPVGPQVTAEEAGDDPRGALIARAAEAEFPMLVANILDEESGERVDWPRMPPTHMLEIAGIKVGFVGVTTMATLRTTIAANVSDLRLRPIAETIEAYARPLREAGAELVIVAAHAGGKCHDFSDSTDLTSCEPEEIFEVAEALPSGLVDVIVAGHTHQAVAHRVNGIAIIESYAYGAAFGRVDVTIDRRTRAVFASIFLPPRLLCAERDTPVEQCRPAPYEGAPVVPAVRVASVIASDLERAEQLRAEPVGITIAGTLVQSRSDETALGNWIADLMREARQGDVAVMNGGGIRAPIPAGELRYGAFYEAFPFDNRFAIVRLRGSELAAFIARNIESDAGVFLLSGVRAEAGCAGGEVTVTLRRDDGRLVRPRETLRVVLNEYVATYDDPTLAVARAEGRVEIEEGRPIREVLVQRLRARGGTLRVDDPALYDPERPRLRTPARPVRCE